MYKIDNIYKEIRKDAETYLSMMKSYNISRQHARKIGNKAEEQKYKDLADDAYKNYLKATESAKVVIIEKAYFFL